MAGDAEEGSTTYGVYGGSILSGSRTEFPDRQPRGMTVKDATLRSALRRAASRRPICLFPVCITLDLLVLDEETRRPSVTFACNELACQNDMIVPWTTNFCG